MVQLLDVSTGVVVEVDDETAERLADAGYEPVKAKPAAKKSTPAKKPD